MAIPKVTAYKQYKEIDIHIEKYIVVYFSRLSRLDSKKTECVCICISSGLYCSRSQFAGMIGPQGYAPSIAFQEKTKYYSLYYSS